MQMKTIASIILVLVFKNKKYIKKYIINLRLHANDFELYLNTRVKPSEKFFYWLE